MQQVCGVNMGLFNKGKENQAIEQERAKVREVFASYDVATKENCAGKRALIMGKLYRRNGEWKFAALGDPYEDKSIVHTIVRVMKDYNK